MNMIEKFFLHFESRYGIDYCNTTYTDGDRKIVNNYKCNQKQFSYLDHWKIQKQGRPTIVGRGLLFQQ